MVIWHPNGTFIGVSGYSRAAYMALLAKRASSVRGSRHKDKLRSEQYIENVGTLEQFPPLVYTVNLSCGISIAGMKMTKRVQAGYNW